MKDHPSTKDGHGHGHGHGHKASKYHKGAASPNEKAVHSPEKPKDLSCGHIRAVYLAARSLNSQADLAPDHQEGDSASPTGSGGIASAKLAMKKILRGSNSVHVAELMTKALKEAAELHRASMPEGVDEEAEIPWKPSAERKRRMAEQAQILTQATKRLQDLATNSESGKPLVDLRGDLEQTLNALSGDFESQRMERERLLKMYDGFAEASKMMRDHLGSMAINLKDMEDLLEASSESMREAAAHANLLREWAFSMSSQGALEEVPDESSLAVATALKRRSGAGPLVAVADKLVSAFSCVPEKGRTGSTGSAEEGAEGGADGLDTLIKLIETTIVSSALQEIQQLATAAVQAAPLASGKMLTPCQSMQQLTEDEEQTASIKDLKASNEDAFLTSLAIQREESDEELTSGDLSKSTMSAVPISHRRIVTRHLTKIGTWTRLEPDVRELAAEEEAGRQRLSCDEMQEARRWEGVRQKALQAASLPGQAPRSIETVIAIRRAQREIERRFRTRLGQPAPPPPNVENWPSKAPPLMRPSHPHFPHFVAMMNNSLDKDSPTSQSSVLPLLTERRYEAPQTWQPYGPYSARKERPGWHQNSGILAA